MSMLSKIGKLLWTKRMGILYSDVVKFYNKLKDNGVDVELNVGEEMMQVCHFPLVPESRDAFKRIVEIILD